MMREPFDVPDNGALLALALELFRDAEEAALTGEALERRAAGSGAKRLGQAKVYHTAALVIERLAGMDPTVLDAMNDGSLLRLLQDMRAKARRAKVEGRAV